MEKTVYKCVCFDETFQIIKDLAEATKCSSLEELQEKDLTDVSKACGFCKPYLELMFKTGETRFYPMDFNNKD